MSNLDAEAEAATYVHRFTLFSSPLQGLRAAQPVFVSPPAINVRPGATTRVEVNFQLPNPSSASDLATWMLFARHGNNVFDTVHCTPLASTVTESQPPDGKASTCSDPEHLVTYRCVDPGSNLGGHDCRPAQLLPPDGWQCGRLRSVIT